MGKSILYKKYQNNNQKNEKAYKQWYARPVSTGTYDLRELCQHIARHGSLLTEDVITAVVIKLCKCIPELVLEGSKVKLDGLGTFYPTFQTEGAETDEDFSADNIKKVRLRFLPDGASDSETATAVMTRKASLASIATLGLTDTANSQSTANSGGITGTDSGNTGTTNGDEPGEDRP